MEQEHEDFPSVELPQLLHVTEQQDHPVSRLIYSDSNDTGASCDIVASISQTDLSKGLLTKIQAETQDEICLDQSSSKKQIKQTKQSNNKDAQQINVKTTTQADDKTLLNVIESADLDQAVQLLKGNNHFSQDELDRALISACHHGHKILVQELICLGANVQFKDTLGNTPLLICADNGFVDIVYFLLKKKVDVNASNSAGDTALILSIRPTGSLEMVRVLLDQNGIDISHQNRDGYTALMKAVEARDVDVIKILMDRYKKDELDGTTSRQVGAPCCLGSIEAVNSRGMTAEGIADKCGLKNIYNILKTHTTTRVLPVMIATERRDTESLNILLNCQFVDKHDIGKAFEKIFKQCGLKNVEMVTTKEIVIIKRLLECGADVNMSWFGGSTPLSVAVKMGDYDLVELFCQRLDQQQQLQFQDVSQVLLETVKSGRCDLINLLLKYKPEINHNQYPGSPLDCALSHGHLEIAKLLVQHGAKMDIDSAFWSAVTKQLPEYMNFVCENYQLEVVSYAATVGNDLNKLLVSASIRGNLEIIGRLLDAGADVNHEKNRHTPLRESNDGNVARFLIYRGAKVNLHLSDGDTILITVLNKAYIEDSSKIEVAKVLLENGASINDSGKEGTTPLMAAASRSKNVAILQFLLDHGADINSQDKRGNTALMEAVRASCPLNVSFLLEFHKEKHLSLNVQNNEGKTALLYAVSDESPKIAKQLIDFGADVNIKDEKGNTPLLYAQLTRFEPLEILTTLIKAGSDVNCQNNNGFSPLMLAASRCWQAAIVVLLDSGADVNAVSEKDSTKTALSFLSDYEYRDFQCCIEPFLQKGASSSYMHSDYLHRMIYRGNIGSIPDLIRSGIAPTEAKSINLILDVDDYNEIPAVSPLCVALLVGNVSLARYFVGNLFLTKSDVPSLTGNKNLYRGIVKRHHHDCLNFLEELSSQPFSLFQLGFVTVLSAVGSTPGRENRVNMLPLPQVMKDKLLFKSQEVQLNFAIQEIDFFSEQSQLINNFDQFGLASTDQDDYSDSDIFYDW